MSLGFYFDMNRCSGCMTCQVACKDRNDLEVGYLYRHMLTFETGEYPDAHMYFYAKTCNHCDMPACVANCPTGAMFKSEDGTMQHDDEACIGCETCVRNCPYGIPVFFPETRIVGKCDSCKALRDAGLNPACVDACPMRALEFGDVDELRAKHVADLVTDLPILPSSETTQPNTLVKPKSYALDESFFQTFV